MDSSIAQFFEGKSVFVTGFSGFVGKLFVAKLAKSTNVKKIYVLIRDKKGVSAEQRTLKILSKLPFTSDKNSNLNEVTSVIPINGDLTLPDLGIKSNEIETLRREVSIIFHSAAEVRFNVNFSTNYLQNVEGTANLIKLCRTFDCIESFVYVSSLFSSGKSTTVEETIKPFKIDFDEVRKRLSRNELDHDEDLKRLITQHPNYYTLTKALAEYLVQLEMKDIPVTIVRPSIIYVAYKEPHPGWGDTIQGVQGLTIAAGVGLLQTVNWNYWTRFEMIPVDICVNTMIASAWYTTMISPAKFQVINLTAGPFHPEWIFGRVFGTAREYAIAYPSMKQLRPLMVPPKIKGASIFFPLQKFLYHSVFAFIVDILLQISGQKKMLYKYACRLNDGLDQIAFFASHSYEVKTDNYINMIESMSPKDKEIFNSDIRQMDYMEMIRNSFFGFRKYFLGDNDANLDESRRRVKLKFPIPLRE